MAPQLLANARWPSQAQEMETLPPAEKRRHSREWPTNAFAVPKVVVRQFGGLWPLPYWICAKCLCVWIGEAGCQKNNKTAASRTNIPCQRCQPRDKKGRLLGKKASGDYTHSWAMEVMRLWFWLFTFTHCFKPNLNIMIGTGGQPSALVRKSCIK